MHYKRRPSDAMLSDNPEDEKTEEFKRAEEERVREWEEWDALKRKRSDEIDKEAEARIRRKQKRKKAP